MSYVPTDPLPVEKGPWCTKCGHVSQSLTNSMDPKRPIAICLRNYPDGKGCGRVIASYNMREAEFAYSTRRRKLTEARHKQHSPDNPRKWATWCRHCDALTPGGQPFGTNTVSTGLAGATGKVVR